MLFSSQFDDEKNTHTCSQRSTIKTSLVFFITLKFTGINLYFEKPTFKVLMDINNEDCLYFNALLVDN